MIGIGRARIEVEGLVPDLGLVILGVEQKRTNAGNIGNLRGAEQRILEQSFAEVASLLGSIRGKAGRPAASPVSGAGLSPVSSISFCRSQK